MCLGNELLVFSYIYVKLVYWQPLLKRKQGLLAGYPLLLGGGRESVGTGRGRVLGQGEGEC